MHIGQTKPSLRRVSNRSVSVSHKGTLFCTGNEITVNAINFWCHRSCCPSLSSTDKLLSTWCLSKDLSHFRSLTQTTLFFNRLQVYLKSGFFSFFFSFSLSQSISNLFIHSTSQLSKQHAILIASHKQLVTPQQRQPLHLLSIKS